jgi:hypothetical protein
MVIDQQYSGMCGCRVQSFLRGIVHG